MVCGCTCASVHGTQVAVGVGAWAYPCFAAQLRLIHGRTSASACGYMVRGCIGESLFDSWVHWSWVHLSCGCTGAFDLGCISAQRAAVRGYVVHRYAGASVCACMDARDARECLIHVCTHALARGCIGYVGAWCISPRVRLVHGCTCVWVCRYLVHGCIQFGVPGCTAAQHVGILARPSSHCGHRLSGGDSPLHPLSPHRRQHSNAEFASVAALLAHYSGAPGGCFCRLAPGRLNPGYEERDPGGGASAWGEAAWAPAAPVGVQHERG